MLRVGLKGIASGEAMWWRRGGTPQTPGAELGAGQTTRVAHTRKEPEGGESREVAGGEPRPSQVSSNARHADLWEHRGYRKSKVVGDEGYSENRESVGN